MAIKIQNVDDFVNKKSNILIYGQSGIGKTTFLGTCKNPKRMLIIATENGLKVLRGKGFSSVIVKNWSDFEEIINFLKSTNCKDYDYIAVDTITELSEMILSEEKKNNSESKNGFAVYGNLKDKIYTAIRTLCEECPVNVIFTAQANEQIVDNVRLLAPALATDSTGQMLPRPMDCVLALTSVDNPENPKSKVRVIQVETDEHYYCKFRTNKKFNSKYQIGLTLDDILELLNGGQNDKK